MTESEKELQARWIIKQDPAPCMCRPVNPKHVEAWRCVTPEVVEAWKAHAQPPVISAGLAKRLAYLWLQFSQDPEAKRLSGRAQETGLDTWDDAAGMTELQKGMFP